jgi:hypothetical protein
MKHLKKVIFFLVFFICVDAANACQCPPSSLSVEEAGKYEIIFKGKIISVTPCGNKFGEAVFEIDELYKGNSAKRFSVLFECNTDCAMEFLAGDEWIIYSRYKQVGSALMDWCSRSRKLFSNEKEDFYAVNYGNDYDDELKFLREKLGLHRLLPGPAVNEKGERNLIPSTNQTILLFVGSLLCIVLFYWLFNRFFKF